VSHRVNHHHQSSSVQAQAAGSHAHAGGSTHDLPAYNLQGLIFVSSLVEPLHSEACAGNRKSLKKAVKVDPEQLGFWRN
jgi:hypothetical protein